MILIGQEPWRNISYVIGEPQYNQVQRFYKKSKQLQNTGYSTAVECALFYSTTKEFNMRT